MIPADLSPDLTAAKRFVEQHPPPGELVFCAVSGAHLYGFPSPDSDVDLKGSHTVPPRTLLGLRPDTPTHDITEWSDGTEYDLTTVELSRLARLLLRGNGNTVEQLFSPYQVRASADLDDLRNLAKGALGKQFFNHYAGFFRSKQHEFEGQARPQVKTMLYAYRVVLTGVHLLLTGEVEPNLVRLAREYSVPEANDLIQLKMETGEHVDMAPAAARVHVEKWAVLQERLLAARESSHLPKVAQNEAEIDAWIISRRLRQL